MNPAVNATATATQLAQFTVCDRIPDTIHVPALEGATMPHPEMIRLTDLVHRLHGGAVHPDCLAPCPAPRPATGSMAVYATKMDLYKRLTHHDALRDAITTISGLVGTSSRGDRTVPDAVVLDQIDDALLALDESGNWPGLHPAQPR